MAQRPQNEADQKRDYYEQESYIRNEFSIGGLASFNAEYGYLEAMLRGFRSGFLKEYELRQLCQCNSLEDVKLTFGDTDYLNALASQQQLTPDIITEKCWDKFVDEFQFLRDQAVGPLATFLDFITYEHLISNISFLITSLIRGADPSTLLAKCNRLGAFPRLKTILTFENSADGLVELYRTVLVDTPVAPYFEKYFESDLKSDEPLHNVERVYNDVEIDIITNMLQKLWLEDFYRFTQSLGGETALYMKELLEFEADRRAIAITINSFGTQLNDPQARESDRRPLYCNFGKLYPEGIESFSKVGDLQSLSEALAPYDTYRRLWAKAQSDGKSLLDALYEFEVFINRLAFESQSHFACFYAYCKLKQQERRNIWWIVSCIHEGREAKEFNRWIKIF